MIVVSAGVQAPGAGFLFVGVGGKQVSQAFGSLADG